MKSLKTLVLSLIVLTAASVAHASESEECFALRLKSMQSVSRELQLPKLICVGWVSATVENSARTSPAMVQFSGFGLESSLPATATGPIHERTISAVAIDVQINRGVCERTASALVVMTFKVNAQGERISAVSFSGELSDTSDNCHLFGELEPITYVQL